MIQQHYSSSLATCSRQAMRYVRVFRFLIIQLGDLDVLFSAQYSVLLGLILRIFYRCLEKFGCPGIPRTAAFLEALSASYPTTALAAFIDQQTCKTTIFTIAIGSSPAGCNLERALAGLYQMHTLIAPQPQ
jgi:hypothetical protein